MQSAALRDGAQEVELRLALPTSDPSNLAQRLARVPVLARRKPVQRHVHKVYYDTPDPVLRRQRVALEIRHVGSEAQARWPHIDPDGAPFASLVPAFSTSFERTLWVVRRRDGSLVEVALDIGHLTAGDQIAPVCELELGLVAGPPTALFEIAQDIARSIAVLPLAQSKSERGYALAQGGLDQALRARPPKLADGWSVPQAAAHILREMFGQFTGNLLALRSADDPEVVHQARIAWRRLRTALRLFKPMLDPAAVPAWQPLQPLLGLLGELRDLDVAATVTLPELAEAYAAGDTQRATAWEAMAHSLRQAAERQRSAVRKALLEPAVGATLLAGTQWLEGLAAVPGHHSAQGRAKPGLRRWSRQRMARMQQQLVRARQNIDSPDGQHRVRILAKRIRYGIEALRHSLARRQAKQWYRQALKLQLRLGAARDVLQAGVLATQQGADQELVAFLHGVAVGQSLRGA